MCLSGDEHVGKWGLSVYVCDVRADFKVGQEMPVQMEQQCGHTENGIQETAYSAAVCEYLYVCLSLTAELCYYSKKR